jgi:hypothetical protein
MRYTVYNKFVQKNKIYFVSGVSGVGKTSTLEHLKKLLSGEKFDVRDFDERGVPDGGGQKWHDEETRYWLDVARENAKQGKNTVISGFADPERFKKVYTPGEDIPAELLLLHASGDTIRKRLHGRHSTPQRIQEIERAAGTPLGTFVEGNVSYAPTLHSIFKENNLVIIVTDDKTSEEIAREIVLYIKKEF